MFALVLLLLLQFISSSSQAVGYPIQVDGPGDLLVQGPLIPDVPEGAEMHPVPLTRLHMFSLQVASHPMFPLVSRNAIRTLLEEGALSSDASLPEYFRYMIEKAADSMNDFNPSILNGDRTPWRVAIFYSYFFELFKLTYPGLRRIKIEPLDLHYLTTISYSISMSHEDENENDLDSFLDQKILLFSGFNRAQGGFSLEVMTLIGSNCKYSVLAAKNKIRFGIHSRSLLLYELGFEAVLEHYLEDRDVFLEYASYVQNINNAQSSCYSGDFDEHNHILLSMIAKGLFYEEVMLRPELKTYRCSTYGLATYEDFYSSALEIAFRYHNTAAVLFLLRLDDSYFEGFPIPDDISVDSDDTPYEFDHPPPVSINELNGLRALFLSETLDQIYQRYPDINNFKFLESSALDIACNYKSDFPALNQLCDQLRRPFDADAPESKRRKNGSNDNYH